MEFDVTRPVRFDVEVAGMPMVDVTPTDGEVVALVIAGVPGADGAPGGFTGVAWWYGSGEPTPSPIGSKEGDFYLNTTDGTVYRLGE